MSLLRRPPARDLHGLVVAVTGAARGIGRDVAGRLVREGALVAVGDLDATGAEATARDLGGSSIGLPLDVTDPVSFSTFLDATGSRLGALDVLVNNAGVMWVGPFAEEPEEAARRQVEVNLLGAMRGVRLAVPRMVARGSGHVVTIASAASKVAPPGEATYAATKHGIYGYLSAVRAELRGSGVDLSVIMPGVVDTELAAGTGSGLARLLQPADVSAAVVATLVRPRFETTVPRSVAALDRVATLLPQGARDRLLRLAVPDQLRSEPGSARAAYEDRNGLRPR